MVNIVPPVALSILVLCLRSYSSLLQILVELRIFSEDILFTQITVHITRNIWLKYKHLTFYYVGFFYRK